MTEYPPRTIPAMNEREQLAHAYHQVARTHEDTAINLRQLADHHQRAANRAHRQGGEYAQAPPPHPTRRLAETRRELAAARQTLGELQDALADIQEAEGDHRDAAARREAATYQLCAAEYDQAAAAELEQAANEDGSPAMQNS